MHVLCSVIYNLGPIRLSDRTQLEGIIRLCEILNFYLTAYKLPRVFTRDLAGVHGIYKTSNDMSAYIIRL